LPEKKTNRLRVQRKVDVPLREVSGICLRRSGRARMSLMAVGDRAAKLAWTALARSDEGELLWQIIDISHLPGSAMPAKNPQIEALCSDGAGRVLLLQESPPRAELVDLDASRVVASIELVIKGRDELAKSWNDPDGSRGEGAVLLKGGHLLVAKEKHPAALIEFGPAGARSRGISTSTVLAEGARWPVKPGRHRFVALAVWRPDKILRACCDDFSDLEIGPDGRLYLLSDMSATIARLGPLRPGGGTATMMAEAWYLEDIDGAKPEGLSFAADGRAVVALDKRKRRNNLVLLDPAIAPRSPGASSSRTR
jgi:hypothetical protein